MPPCKNKGTSGGTDILYANGTDWKVSHSATGNWTLVNTSVVTPKYMDVGDFNGDGKSDIFYANGTEWKISYSATSSWDFLKASGVTTDFINIAEFNGDRKADVFYANGEEWKLSFSGTGMNYLPANNSYLQYEKLLQLGDFNGDGKSDVFGPHINHAGTNYY